MTPEEEFAIYEAVDREPAHLRSTLTLAKLKLAFLQASQEPEPPPVDPRPIRYLGWSDLAPYLDEPDA